jgi:hypothetical protein
LNNFILSIFFQATASRMLWSHHETDSTWSILFPCWILRSRLPIIYPSNNFSFAFAFKIFFYALQNKVFIYRGKEYERLSDFSSRLQNQFPNAQVYTSVFALPHL